MSAPRPMKTNTNAPREGGAAIMTKRCKAINANVDKTLCENTAVHSIVPLPGGRRMHIIAAYIEGGDFKHIDGVVAYATGLGEDVPVAIAADWNQCVDDVLARAPGWHDPMAATNGEQLTQQTSFRHDGNGKRIDYFLVGDALLPYVKEVKTRAEHLMNDHAVVTMRCVFEGRA